MTIDEAIKHAEEVMIENLEKTKDRNASDPIAINCFECADEHRQLAEWLKDYKRLLEQEPTDAINRQSAISLASDLKQDLPDDEHMADMVMAHNEGILEYQTQLSLLPAVKPQEKTGHWEWVQYDSNPNIGNWHCSECRTIIPHMPEETDNTPIYNWCPICGAKMN
jgi:hypothetical protein